VSHRPALIAAADEVIDIGAPGARDNGSDVAAAVPAARPAAPAAGRGPAGPQAPMQVRA